MVKRWSTGFSALLLATSLGASASYPLWNKLNSCARIPSYSGGLKFGIEGLYLKPNFYYSDYALKYATNILFVPELFLENGLYHRVKPDYEFGYRANLGYVFPCTANDVNVAYTHLTDSDRDRVVNSPDFELFSSFFSGRSNNLGFTDVVVIIPVVGPITVDFPIPLTQANMRAQYVYDAWDLEFGQDIRVGCAFKWHWFGGLRFGQIDNDLRAGYEGSFSAPIPDLTGFSLHASTSFNLHQKSAYSGIGPRLGSHLRYEFHNFGLVAEFSTALLIGDMNSSYNDLLHREIFGVFETDPIEVGPTTVVDSTFAFKHHDETRIVPNIEGKLGIDYSYQICNRSRSLVLLEAGWMATHYFNAFDRLSAVGANLPEFRTRNSTDVNFQGPYVGIQVKF